MLSFFTRERIEKHSINLTSFKKQLSGFEEIYDSMADLLLPRDILVSSTKNTRVKVDKDIQTIPNIIEYTHPCTQNQSDILIKQLEKIVNFFSDEKLSIISLISLIVVIELMEHKKVCSGNTQNEENFDSFFDFKITSDEHILLDKLSYTKKLIFDRLRSYYNYDPSILEDKLININKDDLDKIAVNLVSASLKFTSLIKNGSDKKRNQFNSKNQPAQAQDKAEYRPEFKAKAETETEDHIHFDLFSPIQTELKHLYEELESFKEHFNNTIIGGSSSWDSINYLYKQKQEASIRAIIKYEYEMNEKIKNFENKLKISNEELQKSHEYLKKNTEKLNQQYQENLEKMRKQDEIKMSNLINCYETYKKSNFTFDIIIPLHSIFQLRSGLRIYNSLDSTKNSSEHGGWSDLMHIEIDNSHNIPKSISGTHLAVYGHVGVGKTWFINCLLRKEFNRFDFINEVDNSSIKVKYMPLNDKMNVILEAPSFKNSLLLKKKNLDCESFDKYISERDLTENFIIEFVKEIADIHVIIVNRTDINLQILINNLSMNDQLIIVIHNFKDVTTKEEYEKLIKSDIEEPFEVIKYNIEVTLNMKAQVYEQIVNHKKVLHLTLTHANGLLNNANHGTISFIEKLIDQKIIDQHIERKDIVDKMLDFINRRLGEYVIIKDNDDFSMKFEAEYDKELELLQVEPHDYEWDINHSYKELFYSPDNSLDKIRLI